MKTTFHGERFGGDVRNGAGSGQKMKRCLPTILAAVVAAGTILSLAGCRSHENPQSARGPGYPGGSSPYATRGTYYPPGYPREPHQRFAQGSNYPDRAAERGGPSNSFRDGSSYWDGDHLNGSPSITIDLRAQRAYFYKGQQLAGVSHVSTGREGYNTPAGSFRITEKSPGHRSNLYGDYVDARGRVVESNVDIRRDTAPPGTKFRGASMPHFLRFNDAIGMHGGHLPGYPASSGCVRLPEDMARRFFANAPSGTPVTVVR